MRGLNHAQRGEAKRLEPAARCARNEGRVAPRENKTQRNNVTQTHKIITKLKIQGTPGKEDPRCRSLHAFRVQQEALPRSVVCYLTICSSFVPTMPFVYIFKVNYYETSSRKLQERVDGEGEGMSPLLHLVVGVSFRGIFYASPPPPK